MTSTCLYCGQKPCGCTFCPYCDGRIHVGAEVVGVDDPDPCRTLWHRGCRQMWEYDERLGNKMGNSPENDTGQNAANVCPASETISDTD